jgi:hypothetical protein
MAHEFRQNHLLSDYGIHADLRVSLMHQAISGPIQGYSWHGYKSNEFFDLKYKINPPIDLKRFGNPGPCAD